MSDLKYPKIDYDLCPRPLHLLMRGDFCVYAGLMKQWGKCLHSSARVGLLNHKSCPPAAKYKKDLAALRKNAKKEVRHG